MRYLNLFILLLSFSFAKAQIPQDSIDAKKLDSINRRPIIRLVPKPPPEEEPLRIVNFSPFFSLHVDSSLNYKFEINKEADDFYWYLQENTPIGFKIDREKGTLTFKSNKSLFLSGRLEYDKEYAVKFGVKSLTDPYIKLDTTVKVIFYNTDVVYPRIKPSVVSPVTIVEGSRLSFNVLCENGNFAIEKILISSDVSIGNFKLPKNCDDYFEWTPAYDFVTDKDPKGERIVNLEFIGTTNSNYADTARVRVIIKDGLNYDISTKEYNDALDLINTYILRYKFTFYQLDKGIKKNKTWRSGFDITTASTTLTGTVLATTADSKSESQSEQRKTNIGKILPSIGVVALPVKEAASPAKTVEQNQATLLRSNIKRLEYVITENKLSGDRDPEILVKTENLKKELRQSQNQLSEVPMDMSENLSSEQLNKYFDNPKVNKKYRIR